MTDRHDHARTAARDTGAGIAFRGVDTGAQRQNFACTATCPCGRRIDASSLSELRDRIALHTVDCDGAPSRG